MIGQKNNIKTLMSWRMNKAIPRFIILSGPRGSGRLTFAKRIMKYINAQGIILGNSISDVRQAIEYAYTKSEPTCYIFRDADDMRQEAKNALLKVVEEPPNKAYFIMTVHNIDNMLGTIRSRGTVIKMEPYSEEELRSYSDDDYLLDYCSNIGQMQIDKKELEKVQNCVFDVLAALQEKSGTKVLKACTQLQNKQTETDKIDGLLFMGVFERCLGQTARELFTPVCLSYISRCKQEIDKATINKKASIECMLINILEEIKNEIKNEK